MASRYSDLVQAGRSGHRIAVEARFFSPVQTIQPPTQLWVPGYYPGIKRPGVAVTTHLHSSAEVKENV